VLLAGKLTVASPWRRADRYRTPAAIQAVVEVEAAVVERVDISSGEGQVAKGEREDR
jgi:hypothetical protein